MSRNASGYVLTAAAMAEAARLYSIQDFGGAWNTLHPFETSRFGWSGSVIAMLCAWMQENGIELPLSSSPAARLFIGEFEPLICAERPEIDRLRDELERRRPAAGDLVAYCRESMGEDTPGGERLVTEGWDWLLSLLRVESGEWWVLQVD
jgi:hypothetical protein